MAKTTMHKARSLFTLALLGCAAAMPALAQRTNDNVTAQSDDAFGRSVGNESLGIYTSDEVRGFSPVDAGNVRIEGLYFDRQTDPANRLVQGSAIRVGISSQSYPFPSPTGIVDYDLRKPGEQRVISPVLTYGPFDSMGLEVDTQIPLVPGRFGIASGAEVYRSGFGYGTFNHSWAFSLMPRWTPTDDLELRPFYSRNRFTSEEPQPLMFTVGGVLPPKIERDRYYGQQWARAGGVTSTYGFLGTAHPGAWTVRLGLFESVFAPDRGFADLYENIDAANQATERLFVSQGSRFGSKSGELRASRIFENDTRRHTIFLTARGRRQERRYGGDDSIDIGQVELGVGRVVPEPEFQFGEQTHDEVKQHTVGAAYQLQWKKVGEMSVGLQKTSYKKDVESPDNALLTKADPLLANATATWYASEKLAVYGSYAQGLEESPVAPDNAVNRNVAAPALRTRQVDAGIRYTLPRNIHAILGVFEVQKPYFDLDTVDMFRELGNVRHRGIELSLAGSPTPNLTVIAGMRVLDAKVSGPLVDSGEIGATPVAVFRNHAVASVNYAIAGTGFSVDSAFESVSRQMANSENTVQVPSRAVVHVGGRYRFQTFGKPVTVRAQVLNLFDRYGWNVIGGGAYVYNAPRRFTLYVATDL
jgi:iron complex outermembrane recepter protein